MDGSNDVLYFLIMCTPLNFFERKIRHFRGNEPRKIAFDVSINAPLSYDQIFENKKLDKKISIKYSIREVFASFKDLEIIAISVNVNIPTLAYVQALREGMFTLTQVAIISRSLKLVNVSLIEHFIACNRLYRKVSMPKRRPISSYLG